METPLVPMRPVPLQVAGLGPATAVAEEYHPVFVLRGFLNRALDEAYTASAETVIGGRPTYWSSNKGHFIYFQREEARWVISPRYNGNGEMDLLAHVLRGEMRGVAFESGTSGIHTWQEFFHGSWHPVTVQFTKLVTEGRAVSSRGNPPPNDRQKQLAVNTMVPSMSSSAEIGRTYNVDRNKRPLVSASDQVGAQSRQLPKDGVAFVVCEGFSTQALNTTYKVDRELAIGGRSTYWDSTRNYFMYYQVRERRWAISCRDAGGEDLLLDAQRGGIRGFAYEASKEKGGTKWSEFFGGIWQTIEPRVQKLNSVGELSSIAPPQKVVVPQTRPPEPLVAIKVEDATPSIPERCHQESETPVPTQPLASMAPISSSSSYSLTSTLQNKQVTSSSKAPIVESERQTVPPKPSLMDTGRSYADAEPQKDEPLTEELPLAKVTNDKQTNDEQKESKDEAKETKDENDETKKLKKEKKEKKERKHRKEKELVARLRRELRKEMKEKMKRVEGRFGKRKKEAKKERHASKRRRSHSKETSQESDTSQESGEAKPRKKTTKQVAASSDALVISRGAHKERRKSTKLEIPSRLRKRWPREVTDSWPSDEIMACD